MSILNEALEYRKMNLSVIPVGKDKKPLISWKEYQDRHATEDEIKKWWMDYPNANVGIVTGKISGIAVLDCDSQDAISAFLAQYKGETPAAKTPRGMHYYFRYEDGIRNTVKVGNLDMDIRGEGGYVVAPPSVNDKGLSYSWHRIIKDSSALDSLLLLDLYIGGDDKRGFQRPQMSSMSSNVVNHFIQGRRDEDLFHVANCMVKGGASSGIIQQSLEIIARNCNPPYPEKEIEAKIKSALDRAERRERNLTAEVEEFILSSSGVIMSSEVVNCLHLSSREEKKNLNKILTRLCEKGILQKHGDRNGTWRRVENDIEIIDWRNAVTDEYPIDFPLSIGNLVKLYPGNIAVLAGATNTGKTTFMLELIRLNQKRHKIIYMNSEMGASELKLRLEMFHDVCPVDKWDFTAIERSDKFADAIEPDALNIIDFMEIYDEFWKLGGWIRDIHKKLDKGVAVIAVQKGASTKKEQKDYGRGGELTLEKPRLYMAMDRGRIKIVKAKIWRDHNRNPNGLSRNFKIVSGWKFLPADDWSSDEDKEYAKHGIINDKDFPSEKGWNH